MGIINKIKDFFSKKEESQDKEPEKELEPTPTKEPIASCDNCGGDIYEKSDKKTMDKYVLHKKCMRQQIKMAKRQI